MKHFGPLFFFSVLVLVAAITLACGSSPKVNNCNSTQTSPNTTGQLQSISLCPAAADAANYPDGQVQFTATGVFNTAPTEAPIKTNIWAACQANGPTDDVVVSNTGVAKCAAGASGVYSVYTSVPGVCNLVGLCGKGCQTSGYAQLTCP
jgi:hypothetical protein